jgi:serine/threonine protein kinase
MLGGRLLGQGLYGCVFTTPFSCTKKGKGSVGDKASGDKGAKSPIGQLTKLTNPIDAAVEFHLAETIRRIPLWKNYFAVAESMCVPSNTQKEKEVKACTILHERPLSEFRILRMSHAGTPLAEYTVNFKVFQIMQFTTHLLEAGSLLTLFGIAHRDLHQGNIMVDAHQVPRMIDFNLAIPIDTTGDLEGMVMHQYDYNIFHEPPDSTLVMAAAEGRQLARVVRLLATKKGILRKLRTLTGMSETEMEQQLEDVAQDQMVQTGSGAEWFRAYWRSIDSWAIGVTLLDLLSKWAMWPSFTAHFAPYREKIHHVIKQMCVIHPADRMDCVEALQYLHPNSGILRAYGAKWLQEMALRRDERRTERKRRLIDA